MHEQLARQRIDAKLQRPRDLRLNATEVYSLPIMQLLQLAPMERAIRFLFELAGPIFALGLIAVPVSSAAPPGLREPWSGKAQVDAAISEVMREHRLVGASIAVAHRGEMLMARGFGSSDRARGTPVTRDTLFCTASVTKPITAVAIMKLVESGRLRLDARLVEMLADLKPLPGHRMVDPRFRQITVHHLLYHAGGWNRDEDSDGPANAEAISRRAGHRGPMSAAVAYRVALGEPLHFAPGSESHYSNFGYILLRLVIERASGQHYEAFVHQHVFAPMGIERVHLELPESRYSPGETRRYGPNGRELVGGHPLTMGMSGGNWLATPTDLVQFLTAIDGSRGRPVLSADTDELMFAIPPPPLETRDGAAHVGLGWDTVRLVDGKLRYSKNGGRPGVIAWIEHLPNGVDWAVTYNTGYDKKSPPPHPLERTRSLVTPILQAIE